MRKLPKIHDRRSKKVGSAQWISIVAISISMLSLFFSAFQFFDTRNRDIQSKQGQLEVHVGLQQDAKILFTPVQGKDTDFLVQVPFELLVSNTGLVADSIVDWYFVQWHSGRKRIRFLSTSDSLQLLNSDKTPVSFPLSIPAKESRKLFVTVEILVDGSQLAAQGKRIPTNLPLSCVDIRFLVTGTKDVTISLARSADQNRNGTQQLHSLNVGFLLPGTGWLDRDFDFIPWDCEVKQVTSSWMNK